MQADGDAYQRFLQATRLAKTDRTRPAVLSSALHLATEIPLEIAEQATEAGALLHACSAEVKPRVRSDLSVGLVLAIAAADAGRHTVAENIKIQRNQRLKSSILDRIQQMTIRLEELRGLCYTAPLGQSQAGTRKKTCTGIAWESRQTGRMEIKVFNNNVEKALKVAKKKLAGEGLFRELKRRRFYEKPSVRKKAKEREAQRRRQKWLAKRKPE